MPLSCASPELCSLRSIKPRRTRSLEREAAWRLAPPADLLDAAERLAGRAVDVVAVDMPLAKVDIVGRRAADNAVSSEFGARWCSAHSPSRARPGAIGLRVSDGFGQAGYSLKTGRDGDLNRLLLEVYPHPAVLALLNRPKRVPYKVSRSGKYWPGQTVQARIERLLGEFRQIEQALATELGPLPVQLPESREVGRLAHLKPFEDGLDAAVCAWVGVEHLAERTRPLGDGTQRSGVPRRPRSTERANKSLQRTGYTGR